LGAQAAHELERGATVSSDTTSSSSTVHALRRRWKPHKKRWLAAHHAHAWYIEQRWAKVLRSVILCGDRGI